MKKDYILKTISYILFLSLLLTGCTDKEYRTTNEQNSFCYWKTSFSFYNTDNKLWTETSANHMYIRYFDVGWEPISKEPKPIGTLQIYDSVQCENITPSIFFSNNVFTNSTRDQLDTLAIRIKNRVERISNYSETKSLSNKYNEILIDCDWSKNSKENFFYFVEKLKQEIPDKHITTTLRLWQYKNPKAAGVPPVERVLLMCYNVESANTYDIDNSIASIQEIEKYVQGVSYPLKIDIALPIFNWGVIFRDQNFKGVIRNVSISDYQTPQYEQLSENKFRLKEEIVIGDFFARPGDEIRIEMLSKAELKELTSYLLSEIKTDKYSRITFFAWDKNYINNYGTNEIKNIYTTNYR